MFLKSPLVTVWTLILHKDIASRANKKVRLQAWMECVLIWLVLWRKSCCVQAARGYADSSWAKQGANISEDTTNTPPQIQNKKNGLSLLRVEGWKQYKNHKVLCRWIPFAFLACRIGVGCYVHISSGPWSALGEKHIKDGVPGRHWAYFFPFCFMCTIK